MPPHIPQTPSPPQEFSGFQALGSGWQMGDIWEGAGWWDTNQLKCWNGTHSPTEGI